MREEYDFSTAKINPHAKWLKKQVIINIDSDTTDFFKGQSESSGIPDARFVDLQLFNWSVERAVKYSVSQQNARKSMAFFKLANLL